MESSEREDWRGVEEELGALRSPPAVLEERVPSMPRCACTGQASTSTSAAAASLTYVWTSLRWLCTLIRMPTPMKSVRSAVPP